MSRIFETISIGNKVLKNRIAVPPLVVFGLPDDGTDEVQEAQLEHYSRLSDAVPDLLS